MFYECVCNVFLCLQDSLLCDTLHGSMHDRDNSPMMRAGPPPDNHSLTYRDESSPVCKVYRFQTESSRWMLVREQMSDSPLTSSLPKQLLSCYIQEDRRRIQELRDLGDLSPHWEVLRSDVIAHYSHLISTYKETLTELNKLTGSSASFKSSCNKTDRHLEFIPVNLHTQRMQVTSWYDVVTVGAPSDHYQGFKHGGLQRLLNKPDSDKKRCVCVSPVYRSIFYSSDQSSRAREILSSVTQLQPLISGLAEELLQAALEVSPQRVQETLTKLAHRVRHMQTLTHYKHTHTHTTNTRTHTHYKHTHAHYKNMDPSPWHEHLLPLVITLRECVCEAVDRARSAMTFVLLQGAATQASQGLAVTHRRDAVFSQALCAVVCGFALRIYAGVEDKPFLLQLCEVGLVAQFEGLLSTYGDEIGMLEDMEVGVSDLKRISFRITEAKSEQPADLLPTVSGQRGGFCVEVPLPSETYLLLPGELRDGRGLRVHPLLFNIGINQQQSLAERFGDSSLQERINQRSCEMLKSYYSTLREKLPNLTLPSSLSQSTVDDLLTSLDQSLEMKKRKNVEVLWLAASICRRLNGIRLTSCKSAKDRTSMSVTLEQCTLLREEHTLNAELFNKALDCMRREGCRLENVEKNIGSRKYAFNSIQLKTFPKPYRPPEGTYGKVDT
uniref:Inositol polyphosphate-4-phosphatase type II B n=1 Tax=Esox lucius TaxID=8010 RepID=A0A6Q2XVC6_ESOLU